VYNRVMRYMLIAALLVGCSGSSSAPDAAIDARKPYVSCPTDKWFTDLYKGVSLYCDAACIVEADLSPLRSKCFIGGVDTAHTPHPCMRLGFTDACCSQSYDEQNSVRTSTCD